MSARRTLEHSETALRSDGATLPGVLAMPPQAVALVVFAHGSGSSRFSVRNRLVAERLNQANLATLMFDLLTAEEKQFDEQTQALRFDIPLLAQRLTGAVDWIGGYHPTEGMRLGLFGASTGAAAALMTAADRPDSIGAVVCRGGRPDLAADALPRVKAPTLLIVGGDDHAVVDLNQQAARSLECMQAIEIVPGAGHLFEEPNKMEEVACLAAEWFINHVGSGR